MEKLKCRKIGVVCGKDENGKYIGFSFFVAYYNYKELLNEMKMMLNKLKVPVLFLYQDKVEYLTHEEVWDKRSIEKYINENYKNIIKNTKNNQSIIRRK